MIDKELLEILVCPKTHQPLTLADEQLVDQLNKRVESGTLKNSGGAVVESRLEGGLLCREAGLVYPILDGIPVMLLDEAIPLDQLGK